jgi:hypothetical protein
VPLFKIKKKIKPNMHNVTAVKTKTRVELSKGKLPPIEMVRIPSDEKASKN